MIKPVLPEDFAKPEVTMAQLVEWHNANCAESAKVSKTRWRVKTVAIAACQALMKRIDDQIAFEEETDHLSDEEFKKLMFDSAVVEDEPAPKAKKAKKAKYEGAAGVEKIIADAIEGATQPGDDIARQVSPAPRLASNSLGIAASWQDEAVKKARTTRNRVEVIHNNIREEHKSVRAAFIAYALPDEKHIRFRMQLKKSGREVFEYNGEKFEFIIVARED